MIIHAVDLYLVALKCEGDTCFILSTNTNFETLDMKKIWECLCEHHQLKIDKISLGRPSLINAIEFLSTTENILQDLATTALHILCLTWFVRVYESELWATLFKNILRFGKIPHILLILLQHGWTNASKRLLRKEGKHTSNSLYDVLKWYGDRELNKNVNLSECHDKIVSPCMLGKAHKGWLFILILIILFTQCIVHIIELLHVNTYIWCKNLIFIKNIKFNHLHLPSVWFEFIINFQ